MGFDLEHEVGMDEGAGAKTWRPAEICPEEFRDCMEGGLCTGQTERLRWTHP